MAVKVHDPICMCTSCRKLVQKSQMKMVTDWGSPFINSKLLCPECIKSKSKQKEENNKVDDEITKLENYLKEKDLI